MEPSKREPKAKCVVNVGDTDGINQGLFPRPAFAFSNVLMILFGISLSIQKPRSNLLSGVGLSILVIFLYYIMIKSGQTLGYKGVLSPFLSVWVSNIFFFSLGSLLLYRAKT